MSGGITELFKQRVSEVAVANVLALISATPNRREKPLAGDLDGKSSGSWKGQYDFWFDGGACEIITGSSRYVFRDGTVAEVAYCPILSVEVRFPDGRRVTVRQESG